MTLALSACLGLFSIWALFPPEIASNVGPTEFSSARAREYLKPMVAKPHPIGSPAHAEVRDYILAELTKIGIPPQVQRATAVNTLDAGTYRAATVENIVARLAGTNNTRAVLLVGHYDAAPYSLGASDDGAAIVTLLETLRALKASAPLRNDVIFLATDGEEIGLLGARAFVQQHPWAKDVGVVVNFEARGDHGPAIMFQTSDENGRLIEEFAETVPRPVATSLSTDIYKFMPNDTDFTVFKRAGMRGLNFAYIEGSDSYHSSLDNMANLDERSLQHQGTQSLALARRFGNLDLNGPLTESDAVYFDLFGRVLVRYSRTIALGIAVAAVLLILGVIVLGLKRKHLTVSGLAWGFLALLLSMICATLLVMFVSWALNTLAGSGVSFRHGDTWTNHLYLIGFGLMAVASTAFVYGLLRKRASVENLATGALLWFLLLMIASFVYVPGGSYLLMWPLLFAVVAWVLKFTLPPQKLSPVKLCIIATVCAVPGVVLLSPMIYQTFIAFGLSETSLLIVPVTLLLGLFVVNFNLITGAARWFLPAIAGLAAVCFIVAALLQPDFNQRQPKQNELFYALNADTGNAVWASTSEPDEWTSQFLSTNPRTAAMNDYFPWLGDESFLQQQAPATSLPAPKIDVLSDQMDAQARNIHLRVSSAREAATVFIYVDAGVSEAFVNGQPVSAVQTTQQKSWMLIYAAPPREGIDLLLKTESSEPVPIKVVDRSFQLPELVNVTVKPRPGYLIPAKVSFTDSTFVSKSFSLPAVNPDNP
jgi:hypothetical protein